MLLCDYAEELGGKLYIMGGGWTQLRTPYQPSNISLATKPSVRLSAQLLLTPTACDSQKSEVFMMHQEIAVEPVPGSIDVWEFDTLEYGGRLRCSNARTFAYYLLSPSTYGASCESLLTDMQQARIRVYGPRCDEGGRLYITYELTAKGLMVKGASGQVQLTQEEVTGIRLGLKTHLRRTDPDFEKAGRAGEREVLRTLKIP